MTNNQLIAAIEKLILDCKQSAESSPEERSVWLDRADSLAALIESEFDNPVNLEPDTNKE